MPPQNIGGGQFGQAIGGGDALRASMQRRGIDTSILDTVSPAAPTGPSQVAPALPEGVGGIVPEQQVATQAVGTPQPQGIPFRSAEMEISLKALKSVANTESKIAELSLGLR
jgi:hypothetical protein